MESGVALGALVVAEEQKHRGFIRLQREEAFGEDHRDDEREHSAKRLRRGDMPAADIGEEPRGFCENENDGDDQHEPATRSGDAALGTGGLGGVHGGWMNSIKVISS